MVADYLDNAGYRAGRRLVADTDAHSPIRLMLSRKKGN
jgi:hypothetical protein